MRQTLVFVAFDRLLPVLLRLHEVHDVDVRLGIEEESGLGEGGRNGRE